MKYADVRDQIRTGDMLLWRNVKSSGTRSVIEHWLVKHGTASPYTHVGVALVEHDRVSVMDLTTTGCAPRLLSSDIPCDWAPAPQPLSEAALTFAFSCFGKLVYYRWRAIVAAFRAFVTGQESPGECAEYALSIWMESGIAPTNFATPGACADGALSVWGSSIKELQS